jgi:hypothetical protein
MIYVPSALRWLAAAAIAFAVVLAQLPVPRLLAL